MLSDKYNIKNLISIIITIVIQYKWILTILFVLIFVHQITKTRIDIELNTDSNNSFSIYWAEKGSSFHESRKIGFHIFKDKFRYKVDFNSFFKNIYKIRIDPLISEGRITINKIVINDKYFKPIVFDRKSDFEKFIPTNNIKSISYDSNQMTIVSEGIDPSFALSIKPSFDLKCLIKIILFSAFVSIGTIVFLVILKSTLFPKFNYSIKTSSDVMCMLIRNISNKYIKKYSHEIITVIGLLSTYLMSIYLLSLDQQSFSMRFAGNFAIILLDLLLMLAYLRLIKYSKSIFFLIVIHLLLLASIFLQFESSFHLTEINKEINIKEYIFTLNSLMLIIFFILNRTDFKLKTINDRERLSSDYVLLLLLAVPILNYASHNSDFLITETTIILFIILLSIPTLLLFFIHFVLYKYVRNDLLFPIVIGCFYSFYSMPQFASLLKLRSDDNIIFHILILIFISTLLCILYAKNKKILYIITVVLFGSAFVDYAVINVENNHKINKLFNMDIPQSSPNKFNMKPDIYFLIYDGYAQPSLMEYYGIDNHSQMNFLKENSFVFYEKTYSLGAASLESMALTLGMSYETSMGRKDWNRQNWRKMLSGNNIVNYYLKKSGYKTYYVLSHYLLQGEGKIGDYVFPRPSKNSGMEMILNGIRQGEFKFDTPPLENYTYEEWLNEKRQIINAQSNYPKFLYAHFIYPGHSNNSGKCLPDGTKIYAGRLKIANRQMREDIEAILKKNKDAVIIIAGDHGPHLTGDCFTLAGYNEDEVTSVHLVDRYGMLLAIRWPDQGYKEYDNITVLQDVFFSVFAYLTRDQSIFNHQLVGKTYPYGSIPEGAIIGGKVMWGKDKGRKLCDILIYPKRHLNFILKGE